MELAIKKAISVQKPVLNFSISRRMVGHRPISNFEAIRLPPTHMAFAAVFLFILDYDVAASLSGRDG